MSATLAIVRREIRARMAELEPIQEEYDRLTEAASRLTAITVTPHASRRPIPQRHRQPAVRGTRVTQALEAITHQPGITPREIAAKIGVNVTYAYRVLRPLQDSGKIQRVGKGWAIANT